MSSGVVMLTIPAVMYKRHERTSVKEAWFCSQVMTGDLGTTVSNFKQASNPTVTAAKAIYTEQLTSQVHEQAATSSLGGCDLE
eukprot:5880620-Amphidinium_carterae.1